MTIMGISWLNYTESVRHNIAQETETHRSNVVNEAVRIGTLAETVRSNRAMEQYRTASLDEQIRSNLVNESIAWTNASTNITNAQSGVIQAGAAQRNAQTNAMNLGLQQQSNNIRWYDAQTQRLNQQNTAGTDAYRRSLLTAQASAEWMKAIGEVIPG